MEEKIMFVEAQIEYAKAEVNSLEETSSDSSPYASSNFEFARIVVEGGELITGNNGGLGISINVKEVIEMNAQSFLRVVNFEDGNEKEQATEEKLQKDLWDIWESVQLDIWSTAKGSIASSRNFASGSDSRGKISRFISSSIEVNGEAWPSSPADAAVELRKACDLEAEEHLQSVFEGIWNAFQEAMPQERQDQDLITKCVLFRYRQHGKKLMLMVVTVDKKKSDESFREAVLVRSFYSFSYPSL
ncbi:unnamed protein product [Amoebophrya sp. A25]|nr:unnamed protein product [Amoebophrya sp. A25]|eukprot:GSA25T00022723001.1